MLRLRERTEVISFPEVRTFFFLPTNALPSLQPSSLYVADVVVPPSCCPNVLVASASRCIATLLTPPPRRTSSSSHCSRVTLLPPSLLSHSSSSIVSLSLAQGFSRCLHFAHWVHHRQLSASRFWVRCCLCLHLSGALVVPFLSHVVASILVTTASICVS